MFMAKAKVEKTNDENSVEDIPLLKEKPRRMNLKTYLGTTKLDGVVKTMLLMQLEKAKALTAQQWSELVTKEMTRKVS
jgi:hypothetical protein